ncbi:MAG: HAD family hydrolase [Deltaproteobacteria bacterium]|nr:HAD family hydrolase [Deltaproteobacteria bacterium]
MLKNYGLETRKIRHQINERLNNETAKNVDININTDRGIDRFSGLEMPIIPADIRAIIFDFGNTLIEFGPRQIEYEYAALQKALTEMFGTCDTQHIKAIRDRQIVAPFNNDYKENDIRAICAELIKDAYDVVPSAEQVDILLQVRYDSFLHVVELPEGVLPLLEKLQRRYCLAMISNYPSSRTTLDSLAKIGLAEMFEAVVISDDVGYVKPHPRPFEAMMVYIGFAPEQCVYIGDNWLADVQGAKRIGMRAIHTTQYLPYEFFDPAEGDYEPDTRISHIDELESLLLS